MWDRSQVKEIRQIKKNFFSIIMQLWSPCAHWLYQFQADWSRLVFLDPDRQYLKTLIWEPSVLTPNMQESMFYKLSATWLLYLFVWVNAARGSMKIAHTPYEYSYCTLQVKVETKDSVVKSIWENNFLWIIWVPRHEFHIRNFDEP